MAKKSGKKNRTRNSSLSLSVSSNPQTGPRTRRGKRKSSLNSLKHGIFSKIVVLPNESRSDFDELYVGLIESWLPQGKMEELLVEKLAVLFWRYRRLTMAECAEIGKVTEFLEFESGREKHFGVADSELWNQSVNGMLYRCTNGNVYRRAAELLTQLRQDIQQTGFDFRDHLKQLRLIYGPVNDENFPSAFFRDYAILAYAKRDGDKPNANYDRKHSIMEKEFSEKAIPLIDNEVGRLIELGKLCDDHDNDLMDYTEKASSVPAEKTMNRILRYEANLERAIDRTMTQLERLQRMRAGQMIPPPIKVEVTEGS